MESNEIELLKFREKNIFGGHDEHDDHDEHADEHGDEHDDHDEDADEHGDEHDEHGDGHGDHAFEWAGVFELEAGTYKWSFAKVDGDYADPAMKMVILQSDDIEASEEKAEELLESKESESKSHNEILAVNEKAFMLNFDDNKDITMFTVEIKESGQRSGNTEESSERRA